MISSKRLVGERMSGSTRPAGGRSALGSAVLGLGLLAAAGCGGGGTGSLTGTVTYNGTPIASGTVQAFAANGTAYTGEIGPDGRYTIDNIPVGEVKLSVTSPDPERQYEHLKEMARTEGQKAALKTPEPAAVAAWVPVPSQYEQPDTSGFATAIKKGPNTLDLPLSGPPAPKRGPASKQVLPGRVGAKGG
jgi:hypothetical protein